MNARSFIRRVATTTLVLGTTACEAPTVSRPAFAYNPTQLSGGQLYRWPSGTTITVYVAPQPMGATLDLFAAASNAVAEWNDLPLFDEYRLAFGSLASANVVLVDRSVPLPVTPAPACPFNSGNASGYTYFCPVNGRAVPLAPTSGGPPSATVVISVDPGRLPSQARLDAVVAHELGHALGIGGHSDDAADLMFASPTVRRPSNRDAQTLQFVLGERAAVLLR